MGPTSAPGDAPQPPSPDDPSYAGTVLGALPGAVLVVDGFATVQYATASACELVGVPPGGFVGRSVLEFVSEDTAWAYAAAIALATDYSDVVMGPLRVSLVHSDGTPVDADLWAANHLDDPLIAGIVCLVTDQTTSSGLTEAVAALVDGSGPAEVVTRVVTAMAGHPTVADAALVVLDRPDADEPDGDPLRSVVRTATDLGVRQLYADRERMAAVDERLAAAAEAKGHHALWVEPVPEQHEPPAALVLWRQRDGNPSPNQLRSVFQGAAVIGLALRGAGTARDDDPDRTAGRSRP